MVTALTRCGAAATLLAALAISSASAQPVSDIDRYLERADQETREGAYEAAATTLDLVLALYSVDAAEMPVALFLRHAEASFRAGRHAAAAESATRFLLASDLPADREQQVVDLVKAAEAAMARERETRRVREAAQTGKTGKGLETLGARGRAGRDLRSA